MEFVSSVVYVKGRNVFQNVSVDFFKGIFVVHLILFSTILNFFYHIVQILYTISQ